MDLNAEMPTRANKMTECELAYIAGIIDGEGCIAVERRNVNDGRKYPSYGVTITIVNTDIRLISWLHCRVGGCLVRKNVDPNRNHKPQYQIQIRHTLAEAIINSVRPYLIIKGEQADIALALRRLFVGRGRRHTEESYVAMEHLYQSSRRLNRRGKVTDLDADRLSERGPLANAEHAIVGTASNAKDAEGAEMTPRLRAV